MHVISYTDSEVQNLYGLYNRKKEDPEKIFTILQEKFILNPANEFIRCLFKEELRRFTEGYQQTEEKPELSNQSENDKLASSHTISYFLLTYEVNSADRVAYDPHTYKEISRKPPIINLESYNKLVTMFLELLPKEVFDHELLSPTPVRKYDYYSVVSLVFTRAIKSLKRKNLELIIKLRDDSDLLNQIYETPDNYKESIPFWLYRAIRLLKRGVSIDHGYVEGINPIFVECTRVDFMSYLCPSLLKHLKTPNRAGICGQTPLHAVIIKKLPVSILKQLLAMGADKEARMTESVFNSTKRTALEIATAIGNADAVKVLLEHYADPNSYSERNNDLLIFSSEPILTPFQVAVLHPDQNILGLYFSYRDTTGVKLCADLDPREQKERSNKLSRMMLPGEATLDCTAAAVQIQVEDNLVWQIERLFAYAEDESTRHNLRQALKWMFDAAKDCAAGSIWRPVLSTFIKEIKTNRKFTITAMAHKEVGACYNQDTKSDIYVYPGQTFMTYQHIIPHEVGHLYSMKYQASPRTFLKDFREAMERDGLLDSQSEGYRRLPWELQELLDDMHLQYKKAQYDSELFPRVCVQFPILYSLTHRNCKEEDLFRLMERIMPETFKLYRNLVMNESKG